MAPFTEPGLFSAWPSSTRPPRWAISLYLSDAADAPIRAANTAAGTDRVEDRKLLRDVIGVPSENEFDPKLQIAITGFAGDVAEGSSSGIYVWIGQVWMIDEVEGLGAKLGRDFLGDPETLEKRHIEIEKARSADDVEPGIAERAGSGQSKSRRVKPEMPHAGSAIIGRAADQIPGLAAAAYARGVIGGNDGL